MGGKLLVTLIVVGLIWAFWRRKNPAQATGNASRFFRALGAAKAAMQHSAQQRTDTDQPTPRPRAQASRDPIEHVRCPKCGGYAPAGQRCSCS